MRGYSSKRILAVLVAALAVSLWAQPGAPLAQTAKPEKAVVKEVAPVKVEKKVVKEIVQPSISKEEKQSIVNEFRREILDDRAAYIDRWLAVVAIFLTFFGIIVAILGIISFRRFQAIEKEARESVEGANKHVEEAKGLVQEIKEYRDETKAIRDETAESAADDPERVRQVAEDTRKNPQASPMDKAIANAISLQQERKFEEAIEAWRRIANVMEGVDDGLAARAWFSIAYLLGQEKKYQETVDAYSRSLVLNPNDAIAFNNRGNAHSDLGQNEDAILDFDEAIRLNPESSEAYNNRGTVKGKLGQSQAAVTDFDEALRLNPKLGEAYHNRGIAKKILSQYEAAIADFNKAIGTSKDFAEAYFSRGTLKAVLGQKDETREDFTKALNLARAAGNEKLAADAERQLQKLDKQ